MINNERQLPMHFCLISLVVNGLVFAMLLVTTLYLLGTCINFY